MHPAISTPRREGRFEVPLLPMEEAVFKGDIVCIGRFVCPPTHALFGNSGPSTTWCIAFPRHSVWIRHRDDQAFVADPTVATLYNRGDEYQRVAIDRRGDHCDWFAVAPDVLLEITQIHHGPRTDDPDRPFDLHRAACALHTYRQQRSLFEYVNRTETPDGMSVEEQTLGIVNRLLANTRPARTLPGRTAREVAEAARAALARHFADSLTIRQLASIVGVSPFHLCHTFRAVTGTTITRYRHELRLRASLELLREYRGRLVDVALDLGYSSHSHFTMAFRRAFHATPSVVSGEL